MKKFSLAILLAASVLTSVSAMEISPYIGGVLGTTSYTTNSGNTSTTESAGIGYGGFAGLALTRYFSVEGAYTSYGEMDNTDAYVSSLAVYLKGALPISYQFHLFGKVGFASSTSHSDGDSNDTGSGFAWAGGLSFKVTKRVSILGQYQEDLAQSGDSKLEPSMWSLGLQYDFY